FFSSRRRHTRSSRDWSSDVCSSDLDAGTQNIIEQTKRGKTDDFFKQNAYHSNAQNNELENYQKRKQRQQTEYIADKAFHYRNGEIGRASCRERGEISEVEVRLEKEE